METSIFLITLTLHENKVLKKKFTSQLEITLLFQQLLDAIYNL